MEEGKLLYSNNYVNIFMNLNTYTGKATILNVLCKN